MTPMEIALLIIGVIIFVLSFFLPDGKVKKTEKQIEDEQNEIRRMMEQELDGMKLKVNEATSDSVDYAVDKAERSLEKVSNEKIMAVNEYSQTILEEINKNHQEVMFLYDMLKEKHTDLTNSVREADAAASKIQNLSASAINASKGLEQELTVVAVTKKGLTDEQRAVFDEVDNTVPSQATSSHLASKAVQQSIMSELSKDSDINGTQNAQAKPSKEVFDVMSGMTYRQDNTGYVAMQTANAVAGSTNAQSVSAQPVAANPVNIQPINTQPVNANAQSAAIQSPVVEQGPVNNNRRILDLHRQGMSTVDIAKELKLGVGEVKLVIDLFK